MLLGDVIEKITKATGIKAVVDKISGKDCGCNKRKQKLNEWQLKNFKPKGHQQ